MKVVNIARGSFLMLGITLFLFILVNLAAYVWLIVDSKEKQIAEAGYFYSGKEKNEIIKKLFPNDPFITSNDPLPPNTHTTVDFISAQAPDYKIGVEGIRYEKKWDNEYVKTSLLDSPTFVLGGSTTFGTGVKSERSIPGWLNNIDQNNIYLNLGTSSYDSIREINRLIYLLKKGYRPKNVVFIDGLNDITNFGRSPYAIHDTPNIWGVLRSRPSDIQIVKGHMQEFNTIRAFVYGMPVTQLLKHIQFYQNELSEKYERHDGVYVEKSLLKKLFEYYWYWANIRVDHRGKLSKDIIGYYKQAIKFIKSLGRGFGFSAYFIYQPIGILDTQNPFIKPGFSSSDLFKIYKHVDSSVKEEILNNKLDMSICSNFTSKEEINRLWVDPTHYSPIGNQYIAKCILTLLRSNSSLNKG